MLTNLIGLLVIAFEMAEATMRSITRKVYLMMSKKEAKEVKEKELKEEPHARKSKMERRAERKAKKERMKHQQQQQQQHNKENRERRGRGQKCRWCGSRRIKAAYWGWRRKLHQSFGLQKQRSHCNQPDTGEMWMAKPICGGTAAAMQRKRKEAAVRKELLAVLERMKILTMKTMKMMKMKMNL
jgi:hypothetical protein